MSEGARPQFPRRSQSFARAPVIPARSIVILAFSRVIPAKAGIQTAEARFAIRNQV